LFLTGSLKEAGVISELTLIGLFDSKKAGLDTSY